MYKKLITNPEEQPLAAQVSEEDLLLNNKVVNETKKEIIALIKNNYQDIAFLEQQLTQTKEKFKVRGIEQADTKLGKEHYFNYIISEVLIDQEIIENIGRYYNSLYLLVALAIRIQGTFADNAIKYVELLAKYSNTDEAIDKETKYIEILEFAFYVGDRLAERNYEFKEIEQEKILNLRNKLIELFVDNEEIAWGIKNAWEYVNKKIELIDYNKSKALFSQDNLLIALLKKYNQKLAELAKEEKLDFQVLYNLIIPYSWKNNTGIRDLLDIKNTNVELLMAELKYLHTLYNNIKSAYIIFLSDKTDENTRKWEEETIFDDYVHLSEEKVNMYYRLLN